VYAPDFLINAGGLINVGIDYLGDWTKEKAYRMTEKIYPTTMDIFKLTDTEDINAQTAAMRLAQKRIDDMAKLKHSI